PTPGSPLFPYTTLFRSDILNVRALVPVSVRAPAEHGTLGNRVTEIIAPLPVHLDDPVARLDAVRITMGGLKESKQALGGEIMTADRKSTRLNSSHVSIS